jgi:hypothetical protein
VNPNPAAPDEPVDLWVEGRLGDEELTSALADRDDELSLLLRTAVTQRPNLTPLESAQAWQRLSASLPRSRPSFPPRAPWWLAAAASVAAAASALATFPPRREAPRPGQYVLLREVAFETQDRSRKVSFKLQLYRTTEAEDARTSHR